MIDYHVHTLLCNHATGTMEAYIQSAIEQGLTEICFLDHLILGPHGGNSSMLLKEVPFYYQAVKQLSHRYRQDISVRVGLEVDYDPEHTDVLDRLTRTFSFDVIAGSIHFLGGVNIASRKTRDQLLLKPVAEWIDLYLKQLTDLIRDDRFDMICHVDILRKFGLMPEAEVGDYFYPILKEIADHGRVLELNTGGLNHPIQTIYPDPALLPECHRLGVMMTMGSDAHAPKDVGRQFDTAQRALRDAGIHQIYGFNRRVPVAIQLLQDTS